MFADDTAPVVGDKYTGKLEIDSNITFKYGKAMI